MLIVSIYINKLYINILNNTNKKKIYYKKLRKIKQIIIIIAIFLKIINSAVIKI